MKQQDVLVETDQSVLNHRKSVNPDQSLEELTIGIQQIINGMKLTEAKPDNKIDK